MTISKLARRCLRAQGWRWSKGWQWSSGHKRKEGRRYQIDTKRKAGVVFHPDPIGQAIAALVIGDDRAGEVEERNARTQAWLESVVEAGKGRKVAS